MGPSIRPAKARRPPIAASRLGAVLLLFLLVGGPLAGLVSQVGGQSGAPNRPPVVWAGEDQTVPESPGESPDECKTEADEDTEACRVVFINTRYSDCPIQDMSFDPDCDSIEYRFRASPVPCNPNPVTGGGLPCKPIGDGSKFIDEVNFPFARPEAVVESDNCKRQTGTAIGTNPDIKIRGAGEPGLFKFTAPQIPPGHAGGCIYTIDVMAYDRNQPPLQGDPGTAGVTDHTKDVDTVIITIMPHSTRPIIEDAKTEMMVCTLTLRQLIDNSPSSLVAPPPLASLDQTGKCDKTDAVDIHEDHGQYLIIGFGPITDDKEVRSVQAILNMTDGLYPHAILVPLTEKIVRQPYILNPHQDEISYWVGQIAVDTPDLTIGTYEIELVVYDSDGGVARIRDDAQMEGTADLLRPDDEPAAPCNDPGGNAPCIFINKAPAAPRPNACFSGVSRTSPFVLGKGLTLRPEVYWGYFNPAVDDPRLSPIFDRDLMRWKVTYQSCVFGSIQDGTAIPSFGPETRLQPPFYLSLDSLFAGEQEVAIRAYDRHGNERQEIVVPLVEDEQAPRYAMPPPMLARPVTTYQDLQSQLVVFVHDDVDSVVTLHINKFNTTTTGRGVAHDHALFSGASLGDKNGTAVILPRMDAITSLDLFGNQDFKTTCDYLFDQDGDGVIDVYYHWANHTLGRILSDADPVTGDVQFVVDRNNNGIADIGEPVVRADKVTDPQGDTTLILQGTDKCIDPFQDQPHLQAWFAMAPTQVFAFNVTRHLLGETPYTISVRDVLFGNFAPQRMGFNYTVNNVKTAAPVSALQGTLETRLAIVDAQVIEAEVVSDGPFLVGDPVALGIKVTQTSAVDPAPAAGSEPKVPLSIIVLEPSPTNPECLDRTQKSCLQVCIVLVGTKGCEIPDIMHAQEVSVVASRPYGQLGPTALDTTGIIPEFQDPGTAALAASPYRPGIHNVLATVGLPASVKEHDPANNEKKVTFEVYLGQVVVGAAPANSAPSGRVFWIRAQTNGLPLIRGGAIEINADGSVGDTYDLRLNESADLPRYDFTYTDGEVSKVAHWEPQTRYSRTFGKDCKALSASEKVVDLSANPPRDPKCRPMTVITPKTDEPVVEKKTPTIGVLAIAAAIAVAFLLRRRK